MRGNRSANTRPELAVRAQLRAAGFTGYRLHWPVPGRPDIAFPGRRIAIFVNGCFWHGCPRCQIKLPEHNAEYWRAKITKNQARDARRVAELEAIGWRPLVVWECDVRAGAKAMVTVVAALWAPGARGAKPDGEA